MEYNSGWITFNARVNPFRFKAGCCNQGCKSRYIYSIKLVVSDCLDQCFLFLSFCKSRPHFDKLNLLSGSPNPQGSLWGSLERGYYCTLIWPWSTEWREQRLIRVLPREHTGHSKHPVPTTQEKTLHMDITRWSISKSHWLYSLQPKTEQLYTVSKNKTGEKKKTGGWLWLRSWTPYCQIQT